MRNIIPGHSARFAVRSLVLVLLLILLAGGWE